MTPEKSIEEIVECSLDEQQCQQECENKTDRTRCPFVTVYPKEFLDGIIRISKQSTAPDKETPDWMLTDIRRGAKFGYKLARSKSIEFKKENEALKEELNYINKVADVSLKSALSIATERDEYKQEIERLKGLIEQLMSGDKLKIVRNSEGNYTAIFNPENL